jgi:hypothetical protein
MNNDQEQSQTQHVPVSQTMEQQGGGRWWENYLVRYLVPTIVGMGCLQWLSRNSGIDLTLFLTIPRDVQNIRTEQLISWFLFGMLFCYIASYPVLVMHATRMLDFRGRAGRVHGASLLGSYGLMLLASLIVLVAAVWRRPEISIVIVAALSAVHLRRLYVVGTVFYKEKNENIEEYSWAYRFYLHLGERRGGAKKDTTAKGTPSPETRAELVESYRHLREHGNSALILIFEMILTGIFYSIFARYSNQPDVAFTWLVVVLVIWCTPAAAIHLLAQHLEQRFSLHDNSVFRKTEILNSENISDSHSPADASLPK